MKVDAFGVEYEVVLKMFWEDERFKDGEEEAYVDFDLKQIIICDCPLPQKGKIKKEIRETQGDLARRGFSDAYCEECKSSDPFPEPTEGQTFPSLLSLNAWEERNELFKKRDFVYWRFMNEYGDV